ncbi:sphingosine kinase, partial [Tremellales sp. Uapishka_1]
MNHQDLPVTLHNDKRGLLTVEEGRLDVLQLSRDGRPPKRLVTTAVRNLLHVHLAPPPSKEHPSRRLDIHALIQKGTSLSLVKLHFLVDAINVPEAEEWVKTAMRAAYEFTKPYRRVLLLVNPVGGKGKGRQIVKETVVPLLEAAGCSVERRETTHKQHAEEIAREIKLEYDVIVAASGDGLICELLNGFAARSDARQALKVPIAQIPTGSANALSINLLGVKDTFNIELACLNVIKGRPLALDLCSVLFLPSSTLRYAFLSQALGLMVDLDIGTENIRWIGDTRFVLGFLKGVIKNQNFKCRLKMRVVQEDKVEMARNARDRARAARGQIVGGGSLDGLVDGVGLLDINSNGKRGGGSQPPEAHGKASNDGLVQEEAKDGDIADGAIPRPQPLEPDGTWKVIESREKTVPAKSAVNQEAMTNGSWIDGEGMLYVYAGTMPWAARDLMQWPVATSGEGVIDLVVQSVVPRTTLISAITGAEKGDAYWMQCQHYYKVSAYTAENLDREGQSLMTVDGEPFEFSTFHVEVHPGMATVLSLDGHFFLSDFLKKHDLK